MAHQLCGRRVLALGLLLGTSAPLRAQQTPTSPPLSVIPPGVAQGSEPYTPAMRDEFERLYRVVLKQAETARRGGDCRGRNAQLLSLGEELREMERAGRLSAADARGRRDYIGELVSLPCPAASGAESAPPIGSVTAPASPAGPQGVSGSDAGRAAFVQTNIDDVEEDIARAEQMRLSGNCPEHEAALEQAREDLAAWTASNLTARIPPLIADDLRGRISAVASRPCPPRGSATAPTAVQIAGGYGEGQVPRANYGFQRDGAIGTADDRPASFSERQIPMLVFQGSASILGVGEFFIGYAEGDARNRTELPVGPAGTARGGVYTDEAQSGSTGASGIVGVSVDTEVRVQSVSAAYRIAFAGIAEGPRTSAGEEDLQSVNSLLIRAMAGVTAAYRDRDHRGVVSITTPVLFNQQLDQGVRELELGVVIGAEAVIPLGTGARFTLGGEVGLQLYDFDLTSVETVTANFGPDQAFTTRLERGKSGVGYTGEIRGELIIDLSGRPIDGGSRGFQLVAGGGGRFVSDRAQIINPFSGTFVQNGGTTFLRTRSALDWFVMAGVRLSWGPARGR